MKSSSDESVWVFAVDGNSATDLQRTAIRKGWSVRQPASATAVSEEILRRRPAVIVVQVPPAPDEAVELIRRVRAKSLPVFVVAVAVSHHNEIEREVRTAGVDAYLDETAQTSLIEKTVGELLERRARAQLTARSPRTAPGRRYWQSLSPFLLPTDMGGGTEFPTAHLLSPGGRARSQHSNAVGTKLSRGSVEREFEHDRARS